MWSTNELYNVLQNETNISKEVADIFFELDSTGSVTTQANLNNMLVMLYRRIETETIIFESISEQPLTTDSFIAWVEKNFDTYSVNLFKQELEVMKKEKKTEKFKENITNLFDNNRTNSNNIFDRIQKQMTPPTVDRRINEVLQNNIERNENG